MNLALFDLDNTLLRGDSDYNWAKFLISKGLLDEKEHTSKNEKFYQDYKDGVLDIYEFCEYQFRPLKNNKRKKLDQLREEYLAQIIKPLISNKARDLVRHHKENKDLCIIITATNSYITKPIANEMGIENLIGTDPEEKEGEFTGAVLGTPSFQSGKVIRIKEWLANHNKNLESFDKTFFYSDSQNDIPLLEAVTNPVVVNPDEILKKIAIEKNWPEITLLD